MVPVAAPPQRMSRLCRSSSSSDTVRFPRYQKIQRMRLRKMSRGPDSTKKSQKLSGAKMPMRSSSSPTTSRMTATDRKKLVQRFCSMVAARRGLASEPTGSLAGGLAAPQQRGPSSFFSRVDLFRRPDTPPTCTHVHPLLVFRFQVCFWAQVAWRPRPLSLITATLQQARRLTANS